MSTRRERRRDRDGAALIVALFAVTILTALAVTFATVARTDAVLAGNRSTAAQAFYAAQSGLNYCRGVLEADDPGTDSAQDEWALLADNPPALDIPGFTLNAVVEDESARLNVNTATKEMLMALPGMTEEAADSILDWRDDDDDPRPLGAESDYYETLAQPYDAANAPFETVDELRLVKGVDQQLFEGDGTDALPGLRNLVTVRSGEPNVDSAGQARLDINAADSSQLEARLGDVLTDEELTALERRIGRGPLSSLSDVLGIGGVPWQDMAQVLDRIRVGDGAFAEGTVNLNTASETVLEAIGLSVDAAQAVVDARASQPLETKGDLAGIPGVSQDMMAAVADHIATKSSVFRISASAQADSRPLRAGVSAVLDRSGQAPKMIAWREEPAPAASEESTLEQVNGP
jgi:type II secretory pathway component PulK